MIAIAKYVIGRFLEVLGMAVLLTGLFLGLSDPAQVRLELTYLGVGAVVFYIGYWLERGGRRGS